MSRRGGDIRGFFQKRPGNSQTRPPASSSTAQSSSIPVKAAAAVSPPAPAIPPSQTRSSQASTPSSTASLPQTPQKSSVARSKTLPRNHVIKGSDEDSDSESGEDSDSSVESLSAIFAKKNKSAAEADRSDGSTESPRYARPSGTATTPQAKRIASIGVHKSPLTLQQKRRRDGVLGSSYKSVASSQPARHKYDMKALLQHARQSEKTEASARIADEWQANVRFDEDDDNHNNVGVDNGNMQEKARAMLAGDGEDEDGDKLVKAIDRTKSRPTRKFCYFFSPEVSPKSAAAKIDRTPFPYDAMKGRWKFMADPTGRDQAMIHHMPHTLVSRGVKLPDELLVWLLRESCVETNTQLRLRYTDLVIRCGGKAARILTTKELYRVLEGLGGSKEAQHDEKFSTILELEDAYEKRDWSPLAAFLRLLADLAPLMSNTTDVILLLLRMSLDPICSTVIRHEHALAMEALITSSPASTEQDKTFASYLNGHVTEMTLRIQAVNSIPRTNPQLRALWRSVARGVLLEHDPVESDEDLNLDLLEQRLKAEDFDISKDTNFEDVKALIHLLDIVIGDGSFLRDKEPLPEDTQTITVSTTTSTTTNTTTTKPSKTPDPVKEADKRFNHKIDTLTTHLESIQNKIHDSNSSERKEAKTALDALAKRLTYSVRTRPPPKRSIFDTHLQREERRKKAVEQVEGGRQRDFMKGWTTSTPTALMKGVDENGVSRNGAGQRVES